MVRGVTFDRAATGGGMGRIRAVVDPIRARASIRASFRMASENDFPSNIGLGASASGFAALATAAAHAVGLRLTPEETSRFARRGAGSATRSVTGGFRKGKKGLADDGSHALHLPAGELPQAVILAPRCP